MKIIYVNCGVKNYVKEDHRSHRRNFFSGFLFATAKVASISAMIFFHVTRRCGCLYFGRGCTTRTFEVCYVYEGYVGSEVVLYI